MKSEIEIIKARSVLVRAIMSDRLNQDQLTLIRGMSVALQWVCGSDDDNTLQRLVDGEQIAIEEIGT
mgnify:CR=1 FL=1